MPVISITADEVRVADRFGDGTVVTAVRVKPDGAVQVVLRRGRSRYSTTRLFDPAAPVRVLRFAGQMAGAR
jgi:hypothetical protein